MLRSQNHKLFENGKIVQNLVPSVTPICGTCNGLGHRFATQNSRFMSGADVKSLADALM